MSSPVQAVPAYKLASLRMIAGRFFIELAAENFHGIRSDVSYNRQVVQWAGNPLQTPAVAHG